MQEDLSTKQEPDTRPGHYYVSALPGIGEAKDGRYWLLAGPWPTHAEALAQVRAVWDYALRVDPVGATWKSYGTCRREVVDGEEAPASKLGNDAMVWTPKTNKQRFADEYAKALGECVADPKFGYAFSVDKVPEVAAKMLIAVERDSANYDGPAFKLTCKRLGIKHTRKAIRAFIAS